MKSKFWNINIGHILSIVIWLISLGTVYGKYLESQASTRREIQEMKISLQDLAEKLNTVNRDGTPDSRRNAERISKIEDLAPRLTEAINDIRWIKQILAKEKGVDAQASVNY